MTLIKDLSPVIGITLFQIIYIILVAVASSSPTMLMKMILGGTFVYAALLSVINYRYLDYEDVGAKIKISLHILSLSVELAFSMALVFFMVNKSNKFAGWEELLWIFTMVGSFAVSAILFQLDAIKYRKRENMLLIYAEVPIRF